MPISKTLESLVEESYCKVKEIYDSPHATKINLMQTDGKLAINVLNHYRTLRQAESGQEQARAVIAKMICESKEEIKEFIKFNLPQIEVGKKLPAHKK